MATLRLYTNANARARLGEERVMAVNLVVDGPTTGLTIRLPTCMMEDLDPGFFAEWFTTIQGPILTRGEADDDQRALVLRIAIAYRAFVEGRPGVKQQDYYMFVALLVHATLSVEPEDDAATALAEVDEWLQETLPLSVLEPNDIPPRCDEPFTGLATRWSFAESVPVAAWDTLAAEAEASASAREAARARDTAVNGAGCPSAARSATTVDDYESDGSCPGLRTPSDQSGSEED